MRSTWPRDEQLAQELDEPVLAVPLDGREGHPEEVELDARAALDDLEVVVEDRVRVGVTDDDPGRVERPPPRRCGAAPGRPGTGSTWVVIARPVRFAARAAARWTRSSAADTHGLSVPISPMIPGDHAGLADPVGRLAHELVGQVVDRAPVDPGLGG